MRCDEADALIDAFAEDALDEAARSTLEAHVASCARCGRAVLASRRLSVAIAALPLAAPSAAADARTLAAVDEERAWARWRARTRRVVLASGAVAAVLTAAMSLLVGTPAFARALDVAPRLFDVGAGWIRWRALPALSEARGTLVACAVLVCVIAALELAFSRGTPARQRAR